MHKEFYIGREGDGDSYSLDMSSFTSLEQLTRTLAEVFAFADTKCAFFVVVSKGWKNKRTALFILFPS
jgi:hypothetical protein